MEYYAREIFSCGVPGQFALLFKIRMASQRRNSLAHLFTLYDLRTDKPFLRIAFVQRKNRHVRLQLESDHWESKFEGSRRKKWPKFDLNQIFDGKWHTIILTMQKKAGTRVSVDCDPTLAAQLLPPLPAVWPEKVTDLKVLIAQDKPMDGFANRNTFKKWFKVSLKKKLKVRGGEREKH